MGRSEGFFVAWDRVAHVVGSELPCPVSWIFSFGPLIRFLGCCILSLWLAPMAPLRICLCSGGFEGNSLFCNFHLVSACGSCFLGIPLGFFGLFCCLF